MNNFMSKEDKNLYEADYQSLSRSQALIEIMKDTKKETTVVGTASWTPLKMEYLLYLAKFKRI